MRQNCLSNVFPDNTPNPGHLVFKHEVQIWGYPTAKIPGVPKRVKGETGSRSGARPPVTIYRKLKRNRGGNGWRPTQAQKMADERQKNSRNARTVTDADWNLVAACLRKEMSPEQAICPPPELISSPHV